jgi:LPXTG-motif cell wall-anchored protein
MYRLPITLALLALVLALPATASAQGNAGIDQYTESPGTDPDTSSPDTTAPGTSGTPADPTGSGVADTSGTATGTATGTSTEAAANDAAAAAGGNLTAGGRQLPATGSETAILAAIGLGLVAGGLLLRLRARQAV